MNYNKSNDIKKNTGSVNISAGNDKIKYYDCSENNCIFEIIENDDDDQDLKEDDMMPRDDISKEEKVKKYTDEIKVSNDKNIANGKIVVKALLDCGKEEVLEGVKVNLYKINGLSPILVKSNITDSDGKTIFSDVEEGNYRVIEVIDKKYFEKPKYINWNEITIDNINKTDSIIVINRLKSQYVKSVYK